MSPLPKLRIRRAKLALVAIYAGLLLMGANLVADYLGLKYLHPGNKRWYLNAYAQQQFEEPIDVVVLGTSKARFGINASRLAEALADEGLGDLEIFNLSQPASSSVRNNALLRDLVASRGCPSVVVVEVSRVGLHPDGVWWRLLGDYVTLRDLPLLAGDLTDLEHADGFLSSSTRGFERFYDHLVRRPDAERVAVEIERRGSQYRQRPWKFPRFPRDKELAPPTEGPRNQGNVNRPTFTLTATPERGMDALATAVRDCSAQLVILQLPSVITLSRQFTTRFEEQFRSELETFAERHGVLYLDYNQVDLGLITDQFRDWNHLNYEGAKILSDHLARQVIAPRLAAPR